MKKVVLVFFLVFSGFAFVNGQTPKGSFSDSVQPFVFTLTKIMMHDVISPPVAARYYAYCMLGAYEIASQNNNNLVPISKLVLSYQPYQIAKKASEYDHQIAALYCILETGKAMLPSGYLLQENEDLFLKSLKKNKVSEKIILASVLVANEMAAHIVKFAHGDNYNKLSAQLRYTPLKGDQYWYPTPPLYMEAIEPNWRIIRPMIIKSSDQFIPPALTSFSKDTNSSFYKLAMEVYNISKNESQGDIDIANFWDCNPFSVSTGGHMMIGFKKITPGAHWMYIAGVAAKNNKLGFDNTILVHTMVSLTLMDAFISSWDEKYRSNRIRPETFINRYIDVKWKPILETPPFPEYTSAHSVISNASAEVLTYLFGDHFSYLDSAEKFLGINPRSFHSFREAATEASFSRLYGGIHYRDGMENGQVEGRALGAYIVGKLKSAGIELQN